MHKVLVNRLGGLSLPRKSVVRLTDRPDMTLDVYLGRKTTKQQTTPNFLAFHGSPHGSLVSFGQHFVTMRVVHLPKGTETSLITESDLISQSDQAVWAMHSCNNCLFMYFYKIIWLSCSP